VTGHCARCALAGRDRISDPPAKVAVLLVSPYFLASRFITTRTASAPGSGADRGNDDSLDPGELLVVRSDGNQDYQAAIPLRPLDCMHGPARRNELRENLQTHRESCRHSPASPNCQPTIAELQDRSLPCRVSSRPCGISLVGLLTPSTYVRTTREALLAQIAALQRQVAPCNPAATARRWPGNVAAGERGIAVGRDFIGNIYQGAPPQNDTEAVALYRRMLALSCRQLPLRGVDVGASDPTGGEKQLDLDQVYVSLNTTAQFRLERKPLRKDSANPLAAEGRPQHSPGRQRRAAEEVTHNSDASRKKPGRCRLAAPP